MEKQLISQNYYICSINESGRMSLIYGTEAKAGFIAAGLLDMLNADVIEIIKKKITVKKELPAELEPLTVLYEYLSSKPRTTAKVIESFCTSFTAKQINRLITDLGESLLKIGAVSKSQSGLTGNKTVYIADDAFKSELILIMKAQIAEKNNSISSEILSLIYILNQTKNLNQYFSKHEIDGVKSKLKELKNDPDNVMVKKLVGYIDEIAAIIAIAVATSIN